MILTLDGPGGAGKGTLAQKLARHYGFFYLDSGSLYRWLAFCCLAHGRPAEQVVVSGASGEGVVLGPALDEALLDGVSLQELPSRFFEDYLALFTPESFATLPRHRSEITSNVAFLAQLPAVREAVFGYQRAMVKRHQHGLVLDGRDMGTVVAPEAPCKFFVTALLEVRAQRRFLELQALDKSLRRPYSEVREALRARDRLDCTRSLAPMRASLDAVLLDTSFLTPDESLHQALGIVERVVERA